MAGFFLKKQYAAIAPKTFAMKLFNLHSHMLHALQSYPQWSCSPAKPRYASDCGARVIASDHLFKKFLSDTVETPKILHLSCNPLSEVNIIGLCSLYFNATDTIMLSGERLSKSSGNNEVSANS